MSVLSLIIVLNYININLCQAAYDSGSQVPMRTYTSDYRTFECWECSRT